MRSTRTDGGDTSRYSLSGEWHRNVDGQLTRVQAYAMRYKLQLFSNFTYFTTPDGDQFLQSDDRKTYGLRASHAFGHKLGALDARSEVGLQLRHDRIRVGLFDTAARAIVSTTRDDNVRETLAGVYGQTSVELTPVLRAIVGVRADHVRNEVDSIATPANSGKASDTLASPKLSLIAGPFEQDRVLLQRRPRLPQQRRARHHRRRSAPTPPTWSRPKATSSACAPKRSPGCRVRSRCGA